MLRRVGFIGIGELARCGQLTFVFERGVVGVGSSSGVDIAAKTDALIGHIFQG
jgi:hypothetical protein